MQAHEFSFQIPGLTIFAKGWGNKSGEPVLALHGWLDNAASYDNLAPLLPELNLVAPDLPGHGLSDWRAPAVAYHFVDWIADIYAMADALAWERFAVIGHSMGAGIAALVAGTFAERVSRLVLIEGLGPLVYKPEDVPARVADYIRTSKSLPKRDPLPHTDRAAAAATLAKVVPNLSLASASRLVVRGTKEVNGGVTWSADPRLRRVSALRFGEEQVQAFLRRITAPTLLLRGDVGWPFAAEVLEARIACIKRRQELCLSGGHHLHMENASAVAAELRTFFGLLSR